MAEPLQIMLFEDNYPDVLYMKKLLDQTRVNYSLKVCEDGEQGLDYLIETSTLNKKLPDIVLLDIKLPKYSGLEVLEKIRDNPLLKNLPAVIVTGSDDPDDLKKAGSLRASYIKKPADFEKLYQLLQVVEHACFSAISDITSANQINRGRGPGARGENSGSYNSVEYRLLLVEDNPHEIRLVQEMLKKSSGANTFIVDAVQDLTSAMNRLADKHFDVIALDLGLPDSQGLEGFLRLQQQAPDVSIVIVTGNDDQNLGREAVEKGAQDFVVKNIHNYEEVLLRSLKYAIHRKRAESLAKDSLIREHYVLQEALAKAPILVMRIDRGLNLTDVNSTTEREFGMDKNALIGKRLLDLLPEVSELDLQNLIERGVPFQHPSTFITRSGAKYHQETFWDLLAWPVHSRDGLVHEGIVLASDVTEKIKAAQQRDEFVQTLAHDIKNPVLGEQRLLNALLNRYGAQIQPAEVSGGLTELFRSNESLVRMLTNLLEAYRFEGNLYRPFATPVNVVEMISDCIIDLKTLLDLGKVKVVTEIGPDVSTFDADLISIKRLLLNILHNAIKYIPPEGQIRISAKRTGDNLVIAITDSGPGLTAAEQASLFQRYSPTENGKRRQHSSGLGLYICRRIAEAHKGSIACSSEINEGATFTITLPLEQALLPMVTS